jgi:hypothetical protein
MLKKISKYENVSKKKKQLIQKIKKEIVVKQ